ncbi:MAG: hypothetical protein WCT39_06180 [Candidatus Margulisiibacteriota bacterium]
MKLHFEVYGISLYSLFRGQECKYEGYDTQALLRAHEWGLLSGGKVRVPPFTNGHSWIYMCDESCTYQAEVDAEQDRFVLVKATSIRESADTIRVLAEGAFEQDRKPDDKEATITFYCVAGDGWHYSLHCYKHAKPIRKD